MAPSKRINMSIPQNLRASKSSAQTFARGSIGRVSKGAKLGRHKTRRLMQKPRWHNLKEFANEACLDNGLPDAGDATSNGDVQGNAAEEQLQIEPTPKAKKRQNEEDKINLHEIPQWPGSFLQTKAKTKDNGNDSINLRDIPQWAGSDPQAQATKAKARGQEINLWDIPQYQPPAARDANSMNLPTSTGEGIDSSVSARGYVSFDGAEMGGLGQAQPHIIFYDGDDPEYYTSLLRKKQRLLLQMQELLETQRRIDACAVDPFSLIREGDDLDAIVNAF
ncbi:hypothetical protein SLS62_003229 [Diatrype stigma]|uniref:Uncharacterized protein n=1 Tax=Diatrype stigma TaxID=117547 RepID=A0AAN9UWR3_9PEZI